jgi:Domain of unknown function (DUF4258)
MQPGYENDEPQATSIIVHVDKPILGYTSIEFTGHALNRMKMRAITQEGVLKVLLVHKQSPGKQPKGNTRVCGDKSPQLRIHVVYRKGRHNPNIITVIPKEPRTR